MNAFEQNARSGLVAVVLAVLVGVAGLAIDPFTAMAVDRTGLPAPAPDIAFRSLEVREVRLRDLRGRVVLLGFFTTS